MKFQSRSVEKSYFDLPDPLLILQQNFRNLANRFSLLSQTLVLFQEREHESEHPRHFRLRP